MSKYIAVIPRAGITRLALVEAGGRSMAQIKEALETNVQMKGIKVAVVNE